jgi:hypothetical protein
VSELSSRFTFRSTAPRDAQGILAVGVGRALLAASRGDRYEKVLR